MQNDPAERPSTSAAILWRTAGVIAVGLGILGIPLPLLPTTPFLLLAAYCFSRGSPRLHHWLVTHPRFGPPIKNWREHGAISRKAKYMALVAMGAAFGFAALFGAPLWALGLQIIVLCGVGIFIFTRPDA